MATTIAPPHPDEYPAFFNGYISLVSEEPDALTALEKQRATIDGWSGMSSEQAGYRYAAGKWSVKEVIAHLIDAERIFAYRLLRISRGDRTPLPAFDENSYVAASGADGRELRDLVTEMRAVRESSLALVGSLSPAALDHRGTVRAGEITARAQAFVLPGHFAHHARLLVERYGLPGA